ncbi:MAG TPA: hypothetical protein VJS42_09900 [Steroidobacteraceae bacterium]|nr:hypothetical protein [Steroidobacteraceae bacterium]
MQRTVVLATVLFAHMALADPLHEIAAGAFQHEESSWIFPQKVADFTRVGSPQTLDGSSDVSAYYELTLNGARILAAVNVYAAGSSLAPALPTASAGTTARFEVGRSRRLAGIKAVQAAGHTVAYIVDTGPWLIGIQASVEQDTRAMERLDAFVRQQAWDSLALSNETCTGPACT